MTGQLQWKCSHNILKGERKNSMIICIIAYTRLVQDILSIKWLNFIILSKMLQWQNPTPDGQWAKIGKIGTDFG